MCSFGFSEASVLVFGLFRPLCPIFLDCISRYTMHFHSLVLSCVWNIQHHSIHVLLCNLIFSLLFRSFGIFLVSYSPLALWKYWFVLKYDPCIGFVFASQSYNLLGQFKLCSSPLLCIIITFSSASINGCTRRLACFFPAGICCLFHASSFIWSCFFSSFASSSCLLFLGRICFCFCYFSFSFESFFFLRGNRLRPFLF